MIVKFFICGEEVSNESLPYLPKVHDTVYFDSMEYTVGRSYIVTDLDNENLLQYGCVDLKLNFIEEGTEEAKQKFNKTSTGVDEYIMSLEEENRKLRDKNEALERYAELCKFSDLEEENDGCN